MPMKYVEPEVFLVHKGITVYHTYSDTITNKKEYWFSTDKMEDDNSEDYIFDVRDVYFLLYDKSVPNMDKETIDATIRKGLDQKKINIPLEQKVAKFERLLGGVSNSKELLDELVEDACRGMISSIRSLSVAEQLIFLLNQYDESFLAEVIIGVEEC